MLEKLHEVVPSVFPRIVERDPVNPISIHAGGLPDAGPATAVPPLTIHSELLKARLVAAETSNLRLLLTVTGVGNVNCHPPPATPAPVVDMLVKLPAELGNP